MSTTILYHNGVYNLYSSVTEEPLFNSGLTLEKLTEWVASNGEAALKDLPSRLKGHMLQGAALVTMEAFGSALKEIATDSPFRSIHFKIFNFTG